MSQNPIPLGLITHNLPAHWLVSLEGQVEILSGPTDATHLSPELEARLGYAEGLFCLLTVKVNESLLARAPRLRVVSNMAVGYDNIDVAACTRRGIPVGNTPGVLTEATADLTLALLLAAARQIPLSSRDAREGRWQTWSPTGWLGMDLQGATLGLVGMGKIGQAVATRAAAFGLRIVYHSRSDRGLPGWQRLELDDLLAQSDFVSLHVPLTAQTRGLINNSTLRKMKPTALLINAARGPVVDTAALLQALQEGWIAGAALDVTDPEPLPTEHPLYSLPNCLIVPHIGSATFRARQRMAELACANLLAGLRGERLPHCVNPEIYEIQDH